MMRIRMLFCAGVAFAIASTAVIAADKAEPYRPKPGEFPDFKKAKAYRGELVFVDHINRRGSLRLQVDGHYHEGKLHHFAMLPYGTIRYRGAPAELQDIPIGTVMYGRFFLPPDPETSAAGNPKGNDVTQPAENHALLLEDDASLCLREGTPWKMKSIELKANGNGELTAVRDGAKDGAGRTGKHTFTIDLSTRFWRGKEVLTLNDLLADGTWKEGKNEIENGGQSVWVGLTWHPRYLYQQFHLTDLWLDEKAIAATGERQQQRHNRYIKHRWMPARVDAVEHGEFGNATVTATLFGGMDETLYADFKTGSGAQMAVAENTLRTYWSNHDGMDGKITSVEKSKSEVPFGSSGITVQLEMNLVLEGFRPGRIVRIRPHNWPKAKPPYEENIKGFDDRWPGPEIFGR